MGVMKDERAVFLAKLCARVLVFVRAVLMRQSGFVCGVCVPVLWNPREVCVCPLGF